MNYHSSDIPPLLRTVLNGSASPAEINALVRHAHRFAVIRLKQLVASGKLHLHSFPLTVESTAIDCIAELFERDSEGAFVEFEHYFSDGNEIHTITDDDCIAGFRSLVFTKLHDGIFALYRENDPILSKILRNVKIAVQQDEAFSITHSLGMVIISIAAADDRSHLPMPTVDDVEGYLAVSVRGVKSVREFVEALKCFFQEKKDLNASASLIDFCVAVKRHLLRHRLPLTVVAPEETGVFNHDTSTLIDETIRHARRDLYERYVESGKMNVRYFDAYIEAIATMIRDTFLHNDGNTTNYGTYLQRFLPEITYEEYRLEHRKRFEYMAKITKRDVRDRLKELLS